MTKECLREVCPQLILYACTSAIGIIILLICDTNRRDVLINILISGLWVGLWTYLMLQVCCNVLNNIFVWLIVSVPILLWVGLIIMVLIKNE